MASRHGSGYKDMFATQAGAKKLRHAMKVVLLLSAILVLAFPCHGHVRLTFPPARYPAYDFLDNVRTQGPCGVPSKSTARRRKQEPGKSMLPELPLISCCTYRERQGTCYHLPNGLQFSTELSSRLPPPSELVQLFIMHYTHLAS